LRRLLAIICFLCLAAGTAFGRNTEPGDVHIGGGSSGFLTGGSFEYDFDVGANARYRTFNAGLRGSVGLFIADGLAFGPYLGLQYTRYKLQELEGFVNTEGVGEIATVTDAEFGVQVAYFMELPNNDTILPSFRVTAFVITRKVEDTENIFFSDGDEDDTGFGFKPTAGVTFLLTPSVGLSILGFFEYETINTNDDFTFIDRDYGLELGIDLFI